MRFSVSMALVDYIPVIFFAIASAISFVFSGYSTLFPGQDFVYSKLRLEYRHSNIRRRDTEEYESELE